MNGGGKKSKEEKNIVINLFSFIHFNALCRDMYENINKFIY